MSPEKVILDAIFDANLSPSEKITLLSIQCRLGKNTKAAISLSTITRDTSTCYKTTLNAVKKLSVKGWLNIEKRAPQQSNVYSLNPDKFEMTTSSKMKGE